MLDLVGPAYPPALRRLHDSIARLAGDSSWVRYYGAIPFEDLHLRYAAADLGLFASSCETISIILLETMASGLPIACSSREPMPEILGEAGVYFDPEKPANVAIALETLINDPNLRAELAKRSYAKAFLYSWKSCADKTFSFLAQNVKAVL